MLSAKSQACIKRLPLRLLFSRSFLTSSLLHGFRPPLRLEGILPGGSGGDVWSSHCWKELMEQLRQAFSAAQLEEAAQASCEYVAACALQTPPRATAGYVQLLCVAVDGVAKDMGRSEAARTAGNAALTRGEAALARCYYTSAAMYAPAGSVALAKALANRAESNLRLAQAGEDASTCGPVSLALAVHSDANRALQFEIDIRLRAKALYRRGRAKLLLGHDASADEDIHAASVSESAAHSAVLEEELHAHQEELIHRDTVELNKAGLGASSVDITSTPGKGNCLMASTNAPAGELLLTEMPLACVPSKHTTTSSFCCSYCLRLCSIAPRECDACSFAVYCSAEHKNLNVHRHECYGRAWPRVLPESIRLAAKLSQVPDQHRVMDLQSAWSFIGREERIELALYSHALAHCLNEFGSDLIKRTSEASLLQVACRVRANAFTVRPFTLWVSAVQSADELGLAVYSTASRANHSCVPNAHASFASNALMEMRNVEGIRAADHLEISYGPELGQQPVWKRQNLLQREYGFSCTCRACTSHETQLRDAQMDGVQCDSCGDGAIPLSKGRLSTACAKCGKTAGYIKEAARKCDDARSNIESARAASASMIEAARMINLALESLQEAKAHPLNRMYAEAYDTSALVHHELGALEEAYHAIEASLRILEAHFNDASLPLAHARAQCAEVAIAAGMQKRFEEVGSYAKASLAIHFGHNRHPRTQALLMSG